MAKTYEPIASQTLASTQTTVTFSSIPQTYTDLILVIQAQVNGSPINTDGNINGDTGANYSFTTVVGNGSAASSFRGTSTSIIRYATAGYTDNTFGHNSINQFLNYSNTTTFKTVLCRANNAANGTSLTINLWRSTAAITSISIIGNPFAIGSTFTLYGVKSA